MYIHKPNATWITFLTVFLLLLLVVVRRPATREPVTGPASLHVAAGSPPVRLKSSFAARGGAVHRCLLRFHQWLPTVTTASSCLLRAETSVRTPCCPPEPPPSLLPLLLRLMRCAAMGESSKLSLSLSLSLILGLSLSLSLYVFLTNTASSRFFPCSLSISLSLSVFLFFAVLAENGLIFSSFYSVLEANEIVLRGTVVDASQACPSLLPWCSLSPTEIGMAGIVHSLNVGARFALKGRKWFVFVLCFQSIPLCFHVFRKQISCTYIFF